MLMMKGERHLRDESRVLTRHDCLPYSSWYGMLLCLFQCLQRWLSRAIPFRGAFHRIPRRRPRVRVGVCRFYPQCIVRFYSQGIRLLRCVQ